MVRLPNWAHELLSSQEFILSTRCQIWSRHLELVLKLRWLSKHFTVHSSLWHTIIDSSHSFKNVEWMGIWVNEMLYVWEWTCLNTKLQTFQTPPPPNSSLYKVISWLVRSKLWYIGSDRQTDGEWTLWGDLLQHIFCQDVHLLIKSHRKIL